MIFKRNQKGKLSLEQLGWIALALILIAVGGTVLWSSFGKSQKSVTDSGVRQGLVCNLAAGEFAQDVRSLNLIRNITVATEQPNAENGWTNTRSYSGLGITGGNDSTTTPPYAISVTGLTAFNFVDATSYGTTQTGSSKLTRFSASPTSNSTQFFIEEICFKK